MVYFVRESYWQSLASDATTFGFLVGSVWFNEKFIGGSLFLNGIILIMFILWMFAKTSKKGKVFATESELLEHLKKSEPAR